MAKEASKRVRKRAHPRVDADISVQVRIDGQPIQVTGRIRNISLGGVFIEIEEPPGFGSDLDLQFTVTANHETIRCKGYVVWSTRTNPERARGMQGIGVRLSDLGITEMRLISDYVGESLP